MNKFHPQKNVFIYIFLATLIAFPFLSFSQELPKVFIENKKLQDQLRAKLQANLTSQLATIPSNYKGKIRKQIIEKHKQRTESIIKRVDKGHFIYGTSLNTYINKIAQEIIKANPQIPQNKINMVVSRYVTPNAACFGEGTLMINVGLINRARSEAELAFVIAHEIAHYTLNHVNENIEKGVQLLNDPSFKDKIKKISNEEYEVNRKLTEFLKEIMYDKSRYTRQQESQADSLGFSYLANTAYATSGAISCLQMLDSADFEKYKSAIAYEERFHSEEFPFKKSWLEEEENPFEIGDKVTFGIIADSLKTHPDCQDRIKALSTDRARLSMNSKNHFLQDQNTFIKITKAAELEALYADFYFKRYGRSLYNALQLLAHDSSVSKSFVHGIIGASLIKIYEAQKNHELGKYLPMPSEETQSESYKQLIVFIRNLRNKELISLAFYYLDKKPAIYLDNDFFLYAITMASKYSERRREYYAYSGLYRKSFPKGLFISHIN
ncbi:MAG: M48 family metallopeptidase [Flammeovirgaceae bacterium]